MSESHDIPRSLASSNYQPSTFWIDDYHHIFLPKKMRHVIRISWQIISNQIKFLISLIFSSTTYKMGATSNSQTLCGLPIVKVLRYWCIFDGLCCLIGIGLCIAFATTEDRNVRVTFGVGAVLAFFMMAADVILLVGLRNGHKPLILLWQMAEPLFAIFTLALFQLGQAYALKIHPPCEVMSFWRVAWLIGATLLRH